VLIGSAADAEEDSLELGSQVAPIEGGLEKGEGRSDELEVEFIRLRPQDTGDIVEILRTTREELDCDQILGSDHRDLDIAEADGAGTREEELLRPGPGEHDVERQLGSGVHEGKHAGPLHEVGDVADPQPKALRLELRDEDFRCVTAQLHGDVRIGREAGRAVGDHRLGAEEIPANAETIEGDAKGREQLNGWRRHLARHRDDA